VSRTSLPWILVPFLVLWACTKSEALSRSLGATCQTASECANLCLPAPTWPGGFCTRSCQKDGDCAVGAVCTTGVCLFSCFDDQDCDFLGDGYGCQTLAGALVCASPHVPDAGVADAR